VHRESIGADHAFLPPAHLPKGRTFEKFSRTSIAWKDIRQPTDGRAALRKQMSTHLYTWQQNESIFMPSL